MDFPMYVYKPRRGLKRGEENKVGFFILFLAFCAQLNLKDLAAALAPAALA